MPSAVAVKTLKAMAEAPAAGAPPSSTIRPCTLVTASGTSGFRPRATSRPSGSPSPSVSGFKGFVWRRSSCPSLSPSPSVSARRGSVPRRTSSPSGMPSPSVSTTRGFVPRRNSWRLVRPSPSLSSAASVASFGLRPYARSYSSVMASPSASLGTRMSMVADPITPSLRAEMIARPRARAVTRPSAPTVAMRGLLVA